MTKLKPTGKFITKEENFDIVQLFGKYHDDKSEENKLKLNTQLQILGVKYNYNWAKHQINPLGEIIEVIEE